MACARGLCARECETAVNDCSVEDKSGTRIPANRVVPFHQGGMISIVPRQHCPASATTRSAEGMLRHSGAAGTRLELYDRWDADNTLA